MTITLHRDAGHPWNAAEGWDQLALRFYDLDMLDEKIDEAVRKHWHIWIRDQAQHRALLYKPSGKQTQWEEDPLRRQGTPRETCLQLKVGDQVYTDFCGHITQHCVTARETGKMSQTGCLLRVTPVVQKSADFGNEYVGSNPWIDAAWFRPVRTQAVVS